MKTYAFTIILAGVDEITDDMVNALYEVGCDDSSPGSSEYVVSIGFDRDAESLGDAIGSAVNDVIRAGFAIARVDIDHAISTQQNARV